MTYEAIIRKLYSANLHQRVKMGLTNVSKLLTALDSSFLETTNSDYQKHQKKPLIVHVAGTNGKGSVCWKLAKSLQANGFKTGLFVSPHVSCFRERVQIDGKYISQEETVKILSDIFTICEEQKIPSTFFEMTTALAFKHFEDENADAIVLETGLGGRLDSTNVVVPDISVITSVSLDHTKILGNSIEEITREKAGIIKPDVPIVIGPRCRKDLVQEIANHRNAKLYQVDGMRSGANDEEVVDFCIENEEIARLTFDVLKNDGKIVEKDPSKTHKAMSSLPPCRFQLIHENGTKRHPLYLLDVAHNPDAMKLLFSRYNSIFNVKGNLKPPRVVVGFSVDKDIDSCIEVVLKHTTIDRIYPVAASHPRAMDGNELKDVIVNAYNTQMDGCKDNSGAPQMLEVFNERIKSNTLNYDIKQTLELAKADRAAELSESDNSDSLDVGPIIFCGSIYSMNEAMACLDVSLPDSDSISVQKAWDERKVGMQNTSDTTKNAEWDNRGVIKKFFDRYDVKKTIKQYGFVGLCFHSIVYVMSLGGVYVAMRNGLEFPESTAYIQETIGMSEDSGRLAIAWSINASLTSLPRSVLTVVATPYIAKYIGHSKENQE